MQPSRVDPWPLFRGALCAAKQIVECDDEKITQAFRKPEVVLVRAAVILLDVRPLQLLPHV